MSEDYRCYERVAAEWRVNERRQREIDEQYPETGAQRRRVQARAEELVARGEAACTVCGEIVRQGEVYTFGGREGSVGITIVGWKHFPAGQGPDGAQRCLRRGGSYLDDPENAMVRGEDGRVEERAWYQVVRLVDE